MELQELLGDAYHEGMTMEELSTALAGIESPFAERDRYKAAVSKSNTEAAGYKKKLKELQENSNSSLTEEQKKYQQLSEQFAGVQKELNITKKSKSLIKQGYSEDQALRASEALESGDFDKFMEIQSEFLSERDKTSQINALKNTPKPAIGTGGDKANLVDYDALIANAQNNGQMAYYMRLQQEQAMASKK